MNKKKLTLILFAFLAIIQVATPLSMIVRRELTLKHGRAFRFRIAPVDPYDAFRGRYLMLRLEQNLVPAPDNIKLSRHQKVYAIIKEDADGFAKFDHVELQSPDEGDYIEARVLYTNIQENNAVVLKMPFDRYYINEKLAPEAEIAYQNATRRGSKEKAFITVYVKSGFAVVDELYIGDKPIIEFIKSQRK